MGTFVGVASVAEAEDDDAALGALAREGRVAKQPLALSDLAQILWLEE